MNNSVTKLIAPEDIEITVNLVNVSVLTSEANSHVAHKLTAMTSHVVDNHVAHTQTKELESNKKRKKPTKSTLFT